MLLHPPLQCATGASGVGWSVWSLVTSKTRRERGKAQGEGGGAKHFHIQTSPSKLTLPSFKRNLGTLYQTLRAAIRMNGATAGGSSCSGGAFQRETSVTQSPVRPRGEQPAEGSRREDAPSRLVEVRGSVGGRGSRVKGHQGTVRRGVRSSRGFEGAPVPWALAVRAMEQQEALPTHARGAPRARQAPQCGGLKRSGVDPTLCSSRACLQAALTAFSVRIVSWHCTFALWPAQRRARGMQCWRPRAGAHEGAKGARSVRHGSVCLDGLPNLFSSTGFWLTLQPQDQATQVPV